MLFERLYHFVYLQYLKLGFNIGLLYSTDELPNTKSTLKQNYDTHLFQEIL